MITIQHVNPAGTQVYMVTLTNGVSIHEALVQIAIEHKIETATFDMLGGLTDATFTAYDFTSQTRHPPLTYCGALEIVSGHGTISQLDSKPHVHVHCTIAMRNTELPIGTELVGGHLAEGKAFAVEVTVTSYLGRPVKRGMHEGTGLNLWNLEDVVRIAKRLEHDEG